MGRRQSMNLAGTALIGQELYALAPNPAGATLFVGSGTGADGSNIYTRGGAGPYNQPERPLASIFGTYGAASYCSASRGDQVIVLPGHVEAVAGAVTIPVGVTVRGLGYGTSRPTLTLGTSTAANIALGAGARLQNCVIAAGLTNLVTMVTLGDGAQLIACQLLMTTASLHALTAVIVNGPNVLVSGNEIEATLSG